VASDKAQLGGLSMTSSCAPNPVAPTGSQHRVDLHNGGYDTYLKVGLVVGVRLASAGCSIELTFGNASGILIPRINLGSLPSGARTRNDVVVTRSPSGTSQHEIIRATVEFASDYETDPLDDDPVTPYTCTTEVNVRL
jgi:hypothetical protein